MVKITKQNFWFNMPILTEGEDLQFEILANHTQSKRAVGGKIFVTSERLLFAPNRLDSLTGGLTVDIAISTVLGATKSPPVYSLSEMFSGAFRSRLCLHTERDGDRFFVVNQLEKTIQRFGEYLARRNQ